MSWAIAELIRRVGAKGWRGVFADAWSTERCALRIWRSESGKWWVSVYPQCWTVGVRRHQAPGWNRWEILIGPVAVEYFEDYVAPDNASEAQRSPEEK